MEHEVLYRPSYSLLKIMLEKGEAVSAEAGAMVSMSEGIQMETSMKGGLLGGLKRKILGGESFFVNTFRASEPGEVTLAPALPGDIYDLDLDGQSLFAQSGAYIASSPDVEMDTKFGGAKTFFSGEGLFLLRLGGTGKVFLSSYGAIHQVDLAPGQRYTVDTGHMVAFDEGVSYKVKRVGGLKSTLFSGEGLVVEFTGPGRVLVQSRSPEAFLSWLIPRIPARGSD
jgi:uncharacterized protein (TIGR00266 family)